MIQLYREYPGLHSIRTQAVSELEDHTPAAIRTQPVTKSGKRLASATIGQLPVAQLPYLNAVDDRLRHASDQPSIGLILCEDKNKIVAEYALRGMDKAIGVSSYQLTRALPKNLRSVLPSIEQLEQELSRTKTSQPTAPAKRRKRK